MLRGDKNWDPGFDNFFYEVVIILFSREKKGEEGKKEKEEGGKEKEKRFS